MPDSGISIACTILHIFSMQQRSTEHVSEVSPNGQKVPREKQTACTLLHERVPHVVPPRVRSPGPKPHD